MAIMFANSLLHVRWFGHLVRQASNSLPHTARHLEKLETELEQTRKRGIKVIETELGWIRGVAETEAEGSLTRGGFEETELEEGLARGLLEE